jgi:large subunit ribosomal protein L19
MKYNKGAILRSIEQPFLRDNLPEFDTGDTVRVDYRVSEGNRSRIQAFEGVVIARNNGKSGARSTFTVRKMSFGTGVERIFPLHSPLISGLTVVRRGRTRRAKLYYLRDLRGKAARLKTDAGRQEVDRVAFRTARDEQRRRDQAMQEEHARAAAEAEAATPAETAPVAEPEATEQNKQD